MIFVSQLISLTLKTPYKIDMQPVNCRLEVWSNHYPDALFWNGHMFCSVSVINHIEIEKREKETVLGGVWKDMGGSEAYEVIIYGSKHVRLLCTAE